MRQPEHSLRRLGLVLVGVMVTALSSCAGHSELKAPCSASARDLAANGPIFASIGSDRCGPMRSINQQ